jgi:hypothetical protein
MMRAVSQRCRPLAVAASGGPRNSIVGIQVGAVARAIMIDMLGPADKLFTMKYMFSRFFLVILLPAFFLLSACDIVLMPVAVVATPFLMAAEQGRIRQDVKVVDVNGRVVAASGRPESEATLAFQTNANTIVCQSDHKIAKFPQALRFRCSKGLSAVGEVYIAVPVFGGASSFSIGVGRNVPGIDNPRVWDTKFTSVCAANFNARKAGAAPFVLDCGRDTTTFDFADKYKSGLGREGTAVATMVPVGQEDYHTTVWINLVR